MSGKNKNRTKEREPAARNASKAEIAAKASYSAAAAPIDRHLPLLFLALALVLGTLYAFIMPPLQVADEMMHFARAYSVSQGVCVASPDIDMPKSFAQLNEQFPHFMERTRKISTADLRLALKTPLNDHDMAGNGRQRSLEGFINQNVYHCLPYLPEAAALNVGRHIGFSPLLLMYLCRMTNLAFYVLLTFVALRLLPDFRTILFCAALAPMALHQAASVSADATIFAVSFLFIAYVFRLAFAKEPEKLALRHYLILAALILFLVLSKTMVCTVFLLLLIPASSFPSRRSRWFVLAAYLALALVCAGIWQHVNAPNMQVQAEERSLRWKVGLQPIDVEANVRFMREHPVDLAFVFLRCLANPNFLYFNLQEFVGHLGWQTVQLPDWLVWIYFALLMAAAATQTRSTRFTWMVRGLVLVFVAVAIGNTLAAGWAVETPKALVEALVAHDPRIETEWARDPQIYSQGRYWIPFALPMLVLFSTGRTRFNPRYFAAIAAAVVVLVSAVALYMVGSTYYL